MWNTFQPQSRTRHVMYPQDGAFLRTVIWYDQMWISTSHIISVVTDARTHAPQINVINAAEVLSSNCRVPVSNAAGMQF